MANYLPLLLVSVNATVVVDDTSLGPTLPRGQVDYLSHRWREEDVWRSWRDMTRRKNEIANGARLENASWRTWWKQRNKLKTVSPETLNWLKDSDVTWLYGPYHTAIDWAPPPKPKPDPGGVDKERAPGESLDLVTPAKQLRSPSLGRPTTRPILKHRSVSELLAIPLPPSPPIDDDDDDDEDDANGGLTGAASALLDFPNRPSLLHTKSDSHIVRWRRAQAYRTDSPAMPESVADEPPSGSNSDRDSAETGVASATPQRRKHISFNTFVEQCIAIDTHSESEAKQRTASMNGRGARLYAAAPHYSRFDEDDDVFEEEEASSPSSSDLEDDEDEDDEDDVLEIRPRSRNNSSTNVHAGAPQMLAPVRRPTLTRSLSNDKDTPATIAPIAPTMLKTAGAPDEEELGVAHTSEQLGPGTLVYVPLSRSGSAYSLLSDRSRGESFEDVHVHRESRFAIGGSGMPSPRLPRAYGPPTPHARFTPGAVVADSPSPIRQPLRSPLRSPLVDDGEDYFANADIGAEYARSAPQPPRRRRSTRDLPATVQLEDAEPRAPAPALVVVEGDAPAEPGHSAPVPVPRSGSARLLSPPMASRSPESPPRGRGRSRSRSVSGSVDSVSMSGGSGERDGRGRSQTRVLGGDRAASATRGSPLGSLSPSSSVVGVAGAAYAGGRERGRENRVRNRTGSTDSLNNPRGRGPARRMGDSLSPPSMADAAPGVALPSRTLGPLPEEAGPSSSAASSALPTPTLGPSVSRAPASPALPMPMPEERAGRTRVPSGPTSPRMPSSPRASRRLSGQGPGLLQVAAPAPVAPRETTSVSPPSGSPAAEGPEASRSPPPGGRKRPEREGSIAARAADMVHSTRGFLTSLWNPTP